MNPGRITGTRRARPLPRNKTAQASRAVFPTPIRLADASFAAEKVYLAFDQPVRLAGVPQYPRGGAGGAGGALPVSAQQTTPTTLTLTYAAGTTAETLWVPDREPAVRNASGGFVNAGVFGPPEASAASAASAARAQEPTLKAA